MLYIFHSSPLDRYRVTVVARYNKELKTFLFSVARCGRRDQFTRKRGVMIATGRLDKNKYLSLGGSREDVQVFVTQAARVAQYLQKHSSFSGYIAYAKKASLKGAPLQVEG